MNTLISSGLRPEAHWALEIICCMKRNGASGPIEVKFWPEAAFLVSVRLKSRLTT